MSFSGNVWKFIIFDLSHGSRRFKNNNFVFNRFVMQKKNQFSLFLLNLKEFFSYFQVCCCSSISIEDEVRRDLNRNPKL